MQTISPNISRYPIPEEGSHAHANDIVMLVHGGELVIGVVISVKGDGATVTLAHNDEGISIPTKDLAVLDIDAYQQGVRENGLIVAPPELVAAGLQGMVAVRFGSSDFKITKAFLMGVKRLEPKPTM